MYYVSILYRFMKAARSSPSFASSSGMAAVKHRVVVSWYYRPGLDPKVMLDFKELYEEPHHVSLGFFWYHLVMTNLANWEITTFSR